MQEADRAGVVGDQQRPAPGAADRQRLKRFMRGQLGELTSAIGQMLDNGKTLSVTVAATDEVLSPNAAAGRLGFSRQHVRRLLDSGELAGEQLPQSSYWKIPMSSILAFEERREQAAREADTFSAELEQLGAPPE